MTVARSHKGGAKPTTLLGGISPSALSFTVVTGGGTGYPDGSAGVFVVTLDAGTASEEKILCSARASDTFTVPGGGRGYDDTTAVSHVNNASVRHTFSAVEAQEANAHIVSTGDPHPQYLTPAEGDAAYLPKAAPTVTSGDATLATGVRLVVGAYGGVDSKISLQTEAGVKGLTIRGAAAQTADLLQFQTDAGDVLASISHDGRLLSQFTGGVGGRTLEVGAADSAGTGYRTVRVSN